MDSRYAYVTYLIDIHQTEMSKNGELIQFNRSKHKGETDLIGINTYNYLKNAFPDYIKGGIIKEENLLQTVNLLYDNLKQEIEKYPDYDLEKFNTFKKQFEENGLLVGEYNEKNKDDIANKYLNLQENFKNYQNNQQISNYNQK